MSYTITEFLSEEAIKSRVHELGREIAQAYHGRELFIIGVMSGSVIFFADLIRAIGMEIEIGFIATSSYGNSTESSGIVKLTHDINKEIAGKDLLIVDDIVDSGRTAKFLIDTFAGRNPTSIRFCAFLDKPSRRIAEVKVDYIGFTVPDEFIVGYGLDYAGKHRNLPYLATIQM